MSSRTSSRSTCTMVPLTRSPSSKSVIVPSMRACISSSVYSVCSMIVPVLLLDHSCVRTPFKLGAPRSWSVAYRLVVSGMFRRRLQGCVHVSGGQQDMAEHDDTLPGQPTAKSTARRASLPTLPEARAYFAPPSSRRSPRSRRAAPPARPHPTSPHSPSPRGARPPRRRLEDEFVVDLQDHARAEALGAQPTIDLDHRELHDVGGRALHRVVHRRALAEGRAGCSWTTPELGDAALAAEQRGRVAGRGAPRRPSRRGRRRTRG